MMLHNVELIVYRGLYTYNLVMTAVQYSVHSRAEIEMQMKVSLFSYTELPREWQCPAVQSLHSGARHVNKKLTRVSVS